MKRAYCSEGKHFPDQVVAFAANADCAVLVNADDTVTNWFDGTAGVPNEVADLAREDESPHCVNHLKCEVDWLEDKRCELCDGTGVSVCVDWVPYGMGNAALESEEYCGNCLMSGDDGAGKCPNCGNTVLWDEDAELFETCDKCGFTDPFNKGAK